MSYSKHAPFVVAAAMLLTLSGSTFAQRNNPFSENPDTRPTIATAKRVDAPVGLTQNVQRVVQPTLAEVTQVYKIGAGDTLQILLANAPNASGYYSVQPDGTIDFPLAGDATRVVGLTSDEAQQLLASRVKLYRDPQVEVKVREFGSHRINVSGLVERNGERYLQREAVPLFTIKADVGVRREASRVIVRRTSGASDTYQLNDIQTDDVLIAAGDTVEFAK